MQLQFISDFKVTAAQMAPKHRDPWQMVMQCPLCTEVLVVRVHVVCGQTRWQILRNQWRMLSHTSNMVVAAGVHPARGRTRLWKKKKKISVCKSICYSLKFMLCKLLHPSGSSYAVKKPFHLIETHLRCVNCLTFVRNKHLWGEQQSRACGLSQLKKLKKIKNKRNKIINKGSL